MRLFIVLILLSVIPVSFARSQAFDADSDAQRPNLLVTGDMEQADGDVPTGWGKTWMSPGVNLLVARDDAVARGGKASLRLRVDGPADAVANVTVQVPGLTGGKYIVEGWIKATPDEPRSLSAGIAQWGGEFRWIERIDNVNDAFDWRPFRKEAILSSESRIQVMVRGRGTVWIDDVSVTAVAPDLTPVARTEQSPTVTHIAAVAPDLLAVIVVEGKIIPNRHVAYEPQPGDQVEASVRRVVLKRGNESVGWLAGPDRNFLTTFEGFAGDRFQVDLSDRPDTYKVVTPGGEVRPVTVWRKSRPVDASSPEFRVVVEHTLLLRLPEPLVEGQSYTIDFGTLNTLEPTAQYTHLPAKVLSPAVHVNQVGYHPLDKGKQAYLSFWAGPGRQVKYAEGLTFQVVDDTTGAQAFTGKVELAWPSDKPERMQRTLNYNKTDVYRMDFSSLTQPGRYRVVVDGIGCSYPFDIRADAWVDAFKVSMKGLMHHRSGIALGPPYTDFVRPRGFHPDDPHVKVQDTTLSILEDPSDPFKALPAKKTGKVVADAWGGYMDAADWDRQARHMWSTSLLLMELMELSPNVSKLNLNSPESGNTIPDVLDEALFGMSLYYRTQLENGGIRYGVESAEHPRNGEPSWLESLEIFAFAPDMLSTHIYTATAARAARLLEPYDKEQAAQYQRSAEKAMAWAEGERPRIQAAIEAGTVKPAGRQLQGMNAARSLAALELYRLTTDEAWHTLFLSTTRLNDAAAPISRWAEFDDRPAAVAYVQMPAAMGSPDVREAARRKLIADADMAMKYQAGNAFELSSEERGQPHHMGFYTVPQVMPQVRAHAITGDAKYLESIVRASNFAAGANPTNYVFTTGIGANPVRRPMHEDSFASGQPAPAGITVYGAFDFGGTIQRTGVFWVNALPQLEPVTFPSLRDWPAVELYFDVRRWIAMNEYTVWTTIGPNAYVWGYLASTTRGN